MACAGGITINTCPSVFGRKIPTLIGAPCRGTTHNCSVRLSAIFGIISADNTSPDAGFQYAATVGMAGFPGFNSRRRVALAAIILSACT